MVRNKLIHNNRPLLAIVLLLVAAIATLPADAKRKKKKEKTPEVVESPVLVEEEAAAIEEIGFDPDSLFFVDIDPDTIRANALRTILPNYRDWQTATLNGKLRMKGLPLSPTARIFMTKGTEITISVRVAILGEMARIQISPNGLLAVNKMKRTYCEESLGNLKDDYPGLIGDLQSLLLARAVILQAGELSEENAEAADFSIGEAYNDAAAWYLDFPKNRTESDDFIYRYTFAADGLLSQFVGGLNAGNKDFALLLEYTYPGQGYDIDITFSKNDTVQFNGSLCFDPVQWDSAPLSPIDLSSKFTKMPIKDFVKSFKF